MKPETRSGHGVTDVAVSATASVSRQDIDRWLRRPDLVRQFPFLSKTRRISCCCRYTIEPDYDYIISAIQFLHPDLRDRFFRLAHGG